MIEIRNLTINFSKKKALDDLSLSLDKGQIVGLVGPNGSGKTTLLRILAGLEKNYKGIIQVLGKDIDYTTKNIISYQSDHLALDDKYKLKDLIKIYEGFFQDFDQEKYKKLIKEFSLSLDMKIKNMSKGMKDKVQIALTLSRKTKIYMFDEPMTGIDPLARKKLTDTIINNFDGEGLLIISTHLISEIENIMDRVVFIKNGKLILNEKVDDIREKHKMGVEEYFEEVL